MEKVYWGQETALTIDNFKIQFYAWPNILYRTLGLIKYATAKVNGENQKINSQKASLIQKIAFQIWEGDKDLFTNFPLSIWQSGSGTQTNMNVNEVIANLANEKCNHKVTVHPNNDVNYAQSTNDVVISAIHIAAVLTIPEVDASLNQLKKTFELLTQKYGSIIKPGRTHQRDAVPLTYAQEWSAYIAQIDELQVSLAFCKAQLLQLPLGGTAVGTGLGAYENFDNAVCNEIKELVGQGFVPSNNKFAHISAHNSVLHLSGVLNVIATFMQKLSQDFIFLASGPECGIQEVLFLGNEAGSSIMAGKINPSQCEMLSMLAYHVMGSHTTISLANAASKLQLNTYRPLIAYHLINSMLLIKDGLRSFNDKFLAKITINTKRIEQWMAKYRFLATAFVPLIGYDATKKLIDYSTEHEVGLLEAAQACTSLSEAEIKKIIDPLNMV